MQGNDLISLWFGTLVVNGNFFRKEGFLCRHSCLCMWDASLWIDWCVLRPPLMLALDIRISKLPHAYFGNDYKWYLFYLLWKWLRSELLPFFVGFPMLMVTPYSILSLFLATLKCLSLLYTLFLMQSWRSFWSLLNHCSGVALLLLWIVVQVSAFLALKTPLNRHSSLSLVDPLKTPLNHCSGFSLVSFKKSCEPLFRSHPSVTMKW